MSEGATFIVERLEAYLADGSKVKSLTFSNGAGAWVRSRGGVFDLSAEMPESERE
jgi:hypothetical protein